MNLDQALQTFIAESRSLLEEMEESLLRLEVEPDNPDTINAIFRAAHTIKGSAGLFGLDAVVSFTHGVESVLDDIRDGKIGVDVDMVGLLLLCRDHISKLINMVAHGDEALDEEDAVRGEQLKAQLERYLPSSLESAAGQASASDETAPELSSRNWHISLKFGPDVLRTGMEPSSFIHYLGSLGEIVSVKTLTDRLPAADEMDPEACYLGFEIEFSSESEKKDIESVFDFVREDCEIHISPPQEKTAAYLERIRNVPANVEMLGEILRETGVVTQPELDGALRKQLSAKDGDRKPLLGEILVEEGKAGKSSVTAALEKQKQTREHKMQETQFVRVHADKLDQLINLVGEMVIAGASTALLAQRTKDALLTESTSVMSRLVEEIRDGALRLRMVEIGDTFNRFNRVVHDVSKELGKDIDLLISGADTELDKTVVEKIGDPLMHLIRNAIDHGIETADVRLSMGKPPRGTVRLNAYHDSGSIVIEVADDGGGLDKSAIMQKAIEKGLVGEGESHSDQEIFNFIFEAGFSTVKEVSNLSGRGVGMDVVRRNIDALRGTTLIESQEGVGTTIRIRLPLTLAIIDGFLMGVGRSAYVVPLDMVEEAIELHIDDANQDCLNLRGEVLPFIRLREYFSLSGKPASRRQSVVVVRYAGQKAGLVVDELMGEFQTVIKPLGNIFQNLRGISGSTILGSGEVALILDVPSLVQLAVATEERVMEQAA